MNDLNVSIEEGESTLKVIAEGYSAPAICSVWCQTQISVEYGFAVEAVKAPYAAKCRNYMQNRPLALVKYDDAAIYLIAITLFHSNP
jgi:hypothetical protein